jgi:hypothetical protein
VEIVDLDLLFQIPQKYARIIIGKGEKARSKGLEEMEMLKNTLETLEKCWGRRPFYRKSKYGRWGKTRAKSVKSWCRWALRRPSQCTSR